MATTPLSRRVRAPFVLLAVAALLVTTAASAQELSGADLVQALRGGGFVLVVRNAKASEELPDERERAPANLEGEREIDAYGQGQMSVMAYAFRELHIPVGDTLTSPAYRSRQSANYLGFGKQAVVDNLAENADPSWLAQRVAEDPPTGRNTVIVAHGSLIENALGPEARGIGAAETLLYRPSEGGAELVARLTVEDWAKLAVN